MALHSPEGIHIFNLFVKDARLDKQEASHARDGFFKQLDTDKDGKVTLSEFLTQLKRAGQSELLKERGLLGNF